MTVEALPAGLAPPQAPPAARRRRRATSARVFVWPDALVTVAWPAAAVVLVSPSPPPSAAVEVILCPFGSGPRDGGGSRHAPRYRCRPGGPGGVYVAELVIALPGKYRLQVSVQGRAVERYPLGRVAVVATALPRRRRRLHNLREDGGAGGAQGYLGASAEQKAMAAAAAPPVYETAFPLSRVVAHRGLFDFFEKSHCDGECCDDAMDRPAYGTTNARGRPAMRARRPNCAVRFARVFGRTFGSDIAFVLEATGAIDINGIVSRIKTALQDMCQADLCKAVRVAIIAYFEHTRANTYTTEGSNGTPINPRMGNSCTIENNETAVLDFTSNLSEVEGFLTSISSRVERIKGQERHKDSDSSHKSVSKLLQQSTDGQARPVALCDGLHKLLDLSWHEHSLKAAVLVGSNPPHGFQCLPEAVIRHRENTMHSAVGHLWHQWENGSKKGLRSWEMEVRRKWAALGHDPWPRGCPCGLPSVPVIAAKLAILGIPTATILTGPAVESWPSQNASVVHPSSSIHEAIRSCFRLISDVSGSYCHIPILAGALPGESAEQHKGQLLLHAMMAAALAVLNRQAQDIFDLSFASDGHDRVSPNGTGKSAGEEGKNAADHYGSDIYAETCLNFNLKVLRVSSLDWLTNPDECVQAPIASNLSESKTPGNLIGEVSASSPGTVCFVDHTQVHHSEFGAHLLRSFQNAIIQSWRYKQKEKVQQEARRLEEPNGSQSTLPSDNSLTAPIHEKAVRALQSRYNRLKLFMPTPATR